MSLRIEDLYKIKGTILLLGENGSGKTYLAQNIHKNSLKRSGEFINFNLASIPETLIESELFGYTRGAFTGAMENKKGVLTSSQNGTLFLDEIGELSLEMQKKLLYLLDEKKYRPLGSNYENKFNGQIIIATNRNLSKMVEQKKFREDLYYRINVFTYYIPPIRTDKNLITELLKSFLQTRFNDITPSTLNYLLNYSWPGNIRQLKNMCEYLQELTHSNIELEQLPIWVRPTQESLSNPYIKEEMLNVPYCTAKQFFEKKYFEFSLKKYQWKINETARKINISKNTLLTMMKKHNLIQV